MPLLHLDPQAIERGVEALRRRHPDESDPELARRCIRDAALCAGAASLALALPAHPALAAVATLAEVILLQRFELVAIARVACLCVPPGTLRGDGDALDALRPFIGRDPARGLAMDLRAPAESTSSSPRSRA